MHAPRPAVIVPDERAWTIWGHDPVALGLTPAGPEDARELLLPSIVPESLAPALEELRQRIPVEPHVTVLEAPQRGDVATHRAHDEHGGHGGHGEHGGDAGHGEHGGHDHHDMMGIVGEPSSDGLVMEPIRFEFGPLSGILAGGLLVAVELDGDVVSECEIRALLSGADPLAPAASNPPEDAWAAIVAVERERAVSHLAWLRSLGRLLGWAQLVAATQHALAPVLAVPPRLTDAARPLAAVTSLIESGRFQRRAAGRGHAPGSETLAGPNGRAAGAHNDARSHDPRYAELGFDAVVAEGADVLARTLVRARDAELAIQLAGRAQSRTDDAGAEVAVEGPRGPVASSGAEARAQAAAAAVGEEWSGAVLTIASFDLSPYEPVP